MITVWTDCHNDVLQELVWTRLVALSRPPVIPSAPSTALPTVPSTETQAALLHTPPFQQFNLLVSEQICVYGGRQKAESKLFHFLFCFVFSMGGFWG